MKTRIYCPQCRQLLVLRRASIESTRVKCQNCGAKFYAGSAEEVASPAAAPSVASPAPPLFPEPSVAAEVAAPESVAAVAEVPDGEAAETSGPKVRRKERVRTVQPKKLPRWVIPLGVAILVVTSALGVFLSQRPPAVGDLPKSDAELPPADSANSTIVRNPNALVYALELRRPDALVGVWELQEPGGGTIDFASNGVVEIKAPLVTADQLELSTRWHINSHEGPVYEIEIGPEMALHKNHRARLVMIDPQTFRLTKYVVPGKLNVRERIFKRRP